MASEANESIDRAREYQEYLDRLTPEQRIAQDVEENFAVLGWEVTGTVDFMYTWNFMLRLECEGVNAQRNVLEEGWTAYMQVPEALKREMGLVDGGEGRTNGVNGFH